MILRNDVSMDLTKPASRRRWGRTAMIVLVTVTQTNVPAAEPFSHDDWTVVLQEFVDERGWVDYLQLAANRKTLDRYLLTIHESSPKSDPSRFPTRQDALAYYLNAYNALIFEGVLSRGPEEKSVWRGLISGYTFFIGMKVMIGGETTNLKKLEDKVVREQFRDPRVHAALNCASLGCPRLPRYAFEAATLDHQLDAAMREFVGEERNCSVDNGARTVHLSKIFSWFEADFLDYEREHGNREPRLIDYVNRYRANDAKVPRDYRVRFFAYDKGINQQ